MIFVKKFLYFIYLLYSFPLLFSLGSSSADGCKHYGVSVYHRVFEHDKIINILFDFFGCWKQNVCANYCCVSVCSVAQWCPTYLQSRGFSLPGSSVHGIFQVRILEWIAISSSRGSSWPRDQSCSSCIGRILYHWAVKLSLVRTINIQAIWLIPRVLNHGKFISLLGIS